MAKPIAGINEYPYGVCGFIANGVRFHNQTTATNYRIYKQRSDVMFDLIDPSTEVVTQKLLLTGTDITGVPLDYSLSDSQLVNMIPRNTFFVRGYNNSQTIEGFVVRFLYNKKILSNGKVLYDIYTPECGIPPIDISNIIVNPIQEGDIQITGTIVVSSGVINTTDMEIKATLPDGSVITGTVLPDGSFVIDIPSGIPSTGNVVINVTSPNYIEKEVTVPIIPSGDDSDYVTEIYVPSSEQTENNGVYTSTVLESVHGRGTDLVLQLQTEGVDRTVFGADVSVSNGNITINKSDDEPYYIVIIGKTLKTNPYVGDISWLATQDEFIYNIPANQHGKQNISVTVYDGENVSSVQLTIESDDEIVLVSNRDFVGRIVIAGKA